MTATLPSVPPVTADQDDEAWRRTLHARVRAYLEPIPVRLGQPDTFDLVVTPWVPESELLRQAVHAMQQPHGCGPILADPDHAQLYWAVPPGTAATWAYPFTARHGQGTVHLPAPACHQGPGLHWLSPWKRTHLVAPRVLMAALADLPRAVAVHAAEAAQAAARAASVPAPSQTATSPPSFGRHATQRPTVRPIPWGTRGVRRTNPRSARPPPRDGITERRQGPPHRAPLLPQVRRHLPPSTRWNPRAPAAGGRCPQAARS